MSSYLKSNRIQLAAATLAIFAVRLAAAQVNGAVASVSFTTVDGGRIEADEYGSGPKAVVLAHGGQFNKASWRPQAERLRSAGFRVLAFNFRGFGKSEGPGQADPLSAPLHLDVLAAVRYLEASGARAVSVVGGSMGGSAAADAVIMCKPGEIKRLVMLGAAHIPIRNASQRQASSSWRATTPMQTGRACRALRLLTNKRPNRNGSSCSMVPLMPSSFSKPWTASALWTRLCVFFRISAALGRTDGSGSNRTDVTASTSERRPVHRCRY